MEYTATQLFLNKSIGIIMILVIWHIVGNIILSPINIHKVEGRLQSIIVIVGRGPACFILALASHFKQLYVKWMEK